MKQNNKNSAPLQSIFTTVVILPVVDMKGAAAPATAQDCGMEQAFGLGYISGPSPNEEFFRSRNLL